jgi:phosphoglycerate dehydrogenase-like enzyme
MSVETVLVLGDLKEPQLAMLSQRLSGTNIVVGSTAEAFHAAAAQATVLFNWSGSLELFRNVFVMCPQLQWVHSRSVGLERTLFPELIASSVPLTNGTGVFSPSLGEFTLAAILYFAKDFRRMIRNQTAGVWEPFDVTPVSGQIVGIVGYGDIGRAIAARVRPLGMSVLAVKRHASNSGAADPLVEMTYTPGHRIEMISRCDYVVVAAPLTAETRGMIGTPEFAAMKSTAVVINVGRGPIIDEQAMLNALRTSQIKGAALDVFDQEPLPQGHPFYKLENVLLSPHCADHTPEWLDDAMELFIAQYESFRKGEPLRNIVNKKLGY